MFGLLRRNLNIGSRKVKERDYKAIIRLILEYASSVWDPNTKINICRIKMAQRKAARLTLNRHHNTSSAEEMLEILEWLTF